SRREKPGSRGLTTLCSQPSDHIQLCPVLAQLPQPESSTGRDDFSPLNWSRLPSKGKQRRLAMTVSGDDPMRLSTILELASEEGFQAFSSLTRNNMPIRVHVSHLSDEALREKFGVKRRAKPRELERPHQVALIKWVRSVQDAYPVLKLLYAVPN